MTRESRTSNQARPARQSLLAAAIALVLALLLSGCSETTVGLGTTQQPLAEVAPPPAEPVAVGILIDQTTSIDAWSRKRARDQVIAFLESLAPPAPQSYEPYPARPAYDVTIRQVRSESSWDARAIVSELHLDALPGLPDRPDEADLSMQAAVDEWDETKSKLVTAAEEARQRVALAVRRVSGLEVQGGRSEIYGGLAALTVDVPAVTGRVLAVLSDLEQNADRQGALAAFKGCTVLVVDLNENAGSARRRHERLEAWAKSRGAENVVFTLVGDAASEISRHAAQGGSSS